VAAAALVAGKLPSVMTVAVASGTRDLQQLGRQQRVDASQHA
jgi:hypothetical protein